VIGHFGFRPGTKTGLTLTTDSKQFVVIEAKMFSPLSKGTSNAPYYDQAARIMACIAWIISQSHRSVDDFESLGFYVFAPEEQITKGVFKAQFDVSSIRKKVKLRIDDYSGHDKKKNSDLQTWYRDFFTPALGHIDLRPIPWKSMIDKTHDPAIQSFYDQCRRFNEKEKPFVTKATEAKW